MLFIVITCFYLICPIIFHKNLNQKLLAFIILALLISDLDYSFIKNIKWYLSTKFNYKNFGIYKSFGTKYFIKPNLDLDQNKKLKKSLKKKKKDKK